MASEYDKGAAVGRDIFRPAGISNFEAWAEMVQERKIIGTSDTWRQGCVDACRRIWSEGNK